MPPFFRVDRELLNKMKEDLIRTIEMKTTDFKSKSDGEEITPDSSFEWRQTRPRSEGFSSPPMAPREVWSVPIEILEAVQDKEERLHYYAIGLSLFLFLLCVLLASMIK